VASERILLQVPMAAGDTVAVTALVRDLHRQYPDIEVGLEATGGGEIAKYNPYLIHLGPGDAVRKIRLNYRTDIDDVFKNGARLHFLDSFHRDLTRQTGIKVTLTDPYPDLHLSQSEQHSSYYQEPYWVVVAGGKPDAATKIWSKAGFQSVIDYTHTRGTNWVQAGCRGDARFQHTHHKLLNVVDRTGQTTLRELIRLIYHAEGVLCGVSLPMLIAAAFSKPCVVVAGGRESWWWTAFTRDNTALPNAAHLITPHHFFHTIGQLDCCQTGGCWSCSVVPPHNDSTFPDGFLCRRPLQLLDGSHLPECLSKIDPILVAAAVLSR